jgi:hypothetical protein
MNQPVYGQKTRTHPLASVDPMKKSGTKGTLATLPAEITATIFHPARLRNLKRPLLLVEILIE